jgi:hypothetical protein
MSYFLVHFLDGGAAPAALVAAPRTLICFRRPLFLTFFLQKVKLTKEYGAELTSFHNDDASH